MIATQVNLRLNAKQSALLAANARAAGMTKSEYMRDLLEKDGEYLTGVEIYRRAGKTAQKFRRAGVVLR